MSIQRVDEDMPDTMAFLREAFGGDVLLNNTTGRYLSDHIEELIAGRVRAALQSARRILADCADRNCRGTMLEESGRLRCVQCRKWEKEC